jgi:8-oxo-dGTP pyrophosphatase MutT (NUDIX family)
LRTRQYNQQGMDHLLQLKMQIIPEVARRKQHALILLQNDKGNFLLGMKKIYPEGIFRMVGGGMEPDEPPYKGAQRELEEETGLKAGIHEVYHLSTVLAQIDETSTGESVEFVTHLFYYNCGNQKLKPSDDLDGIKEVTRTELEALIERYLELPKTIDPNKGFAWYDYGQLYSQIHQIALEAADHVQ